MYESFQFNDRKLYFILYVSFTCTHERMCIYGGYAVGAFHLSELTGQTAFLS